MRNLHALRVPQKVAGPLVIVAAEDDVCACVLGLLQVNVGAELMKIMITG